MKWTWSLIAAASLSAGFVSVAADVVDSSAPSDVVILTQETHDKFIRNNNLTLIKYYAPWCGHCKALAPHYEEAATILKGLKPEAISIAKVDCIEQKDLCSAAGVGGYPTLKVYSQGAASDYGGERTAESIVSVLKKLSQPAMTVLAADEVDDFANSDRVVVIAYAEKGSKEVKALGKVSMLRRAKYTFGHSTTKATNEAFPSIVLYKKFDDRRVVYSNSVDVDSLLAFVDDQSVALMDNIGPENFQMYMDRGLPVAYLFVDATNRDTYGPLVEPLAKEFQGSVSFVYIDSAKYGSYGKNLGLEESWPAFALQKPGKSEKYPFGGSITTESVRTFVKDFIEGKIKPVYKSEPVPKEKFTPGKVQVVVGKNFESVVNEANKDVLMELYAPWCGHCKKLAPIYDELAAKLADHPNIVIAKMDCIDNDLPAGTPYEVQGFPTIKFYKASSGKKSPIDFQGERTLEGLLSFLKETATDGNTIDVTVAEVDESESASPASDEEANEDL